ncbi:MAG: hypothetical protein AAGU15_05525 [Anaerolineaceae bacterium]|mgnify:CR=1 FL=1|jgi:hypothetical protein
MKEHVKHGLRIVLMLAMLLLITLTVLAQSGGGYDLNWNTTDGGGGLSSGGVYSMNGTAGQPEAGVLSGGKYRLYGGFWLVGESATPSEGDLFLPLIVK